MRPDCRGIIVIPALNEAAYIEHALATIFTSVHVLDNPYLFEIYIVDNGSTDGTPGIVKNFIKKHDNCYLLSEKLRGIGYARNTGVRFGLQRDLSRAKKQHDTFWIISTDADVSVPKEWLQRWLMLFDIYRKGIIAGRNTFPVNLQEAYPNAAYVMKYIGRKIDIAEKIFGAINTNGNNMAIDKSTYAVIGPFQQPSIILSSGKKANLAGEDWDIGTRARIMGKTVYINDLPVVLSDRRFRSDPKKFLEGIAYEVKFLKVNASVHKPDIKYSEIEAFVHIATHRQCMHNIEKPILASPNLLKEPAVKYFLGKQLQQRIRKWIGNELKPNMLYERNDFILGYLLSFHKQFGQDICERLLTYNLEVRNEKYI